MNKKKVIAIGLDPAFADYTQFPELTVEKISAFIQSQLESLRKTGFEVESCLIGPEPAAAAEIEHRLTDNRFDCVMIGAGLRVPPEHMVLFEKIINTVHERAPGAKICFNTTPGDTVAAVQRWI